MNYFNETGKLLKSCLKEKVKITAATVVGFLIMGTAAFGAVTVEVNDKSTPDSFKQEVSVLDNKLFTTLQEKFTDGKNNAGQKVNLSFTGDGNVTLEGIKYDNSDFNTDYLLKFDGKNLTATIADGVELSAKNGVIDISSATVTNNGIITKTEGNILSNKKAAINVNGAFGETIFINNGTIKMGDNVSYKSAIELTSNATLTNSGKILGDIKGVNYSGTTEGAIKVGNQTINLLQGSHIEGSIKLLGTGVDTINVTGVTGENGTVEELKYISGADKINITEGSNIKISDGSMTRKFADTGIDNFINVENSSLETYMDLTETGDKFSKNSNLINVYGKDGKNAKVINHGNLKSGNGSSLIYANSTGGSTVEIENYGELTNTSTNWSSVINGKIDENDSKISIVNNGTINTNNYGTAIDITTKNGVIGASGEIINNGTINVNGNLYASGIQVEGASSDVKVTNSSTGKIVVEKGVGITLNTKGVTAENLGTIVVNDENSKAINILSENSTAVNSGVVRAGYDTTNMTDEEIKSHLLGENVTNEGIILDEEGHVVEVVGNELLGDITTTGINEMDRILAIKEGTTATLTGNTTDPAHDKQFNIAGGELKVTGASSIENSHFTITDTAENKGTINVGADFNLTDISINGSGAEIALNIGKGSNVNFAGTNEIAGNIAGEGTVNVNDKFTKFAGDFGASSLNIGTTEKSAEGYFTSDSKFTSNTTINSSNGQITIAIGNDLSNALYNSDKEVTISGNVGFDYSSLTKDTTVDLAKDGVNHDLDGAIAVNDKDSVYKVTIDDNSDTAKFEYNKTLLEDNGYAKELNDINNGFQIIQDKVSAIAGTTEERAALADKVYAGTIYAETMKTAYDNTKLVEDSILSLETENKVGEWTANGKAIYSKNEYDREGILKDYSSEIESTGLMATFEYGLNETSSVGFAFAGVKQDLDTDTGSADGDAFYFGAFANKTLGNNKLTAGLGYQLDKFDANEGIFGGSEEYDSNAFSAYFQAKHMFNLGDGLSFEPKAKLGYTYVDQDSVEDGTFKVDSQDMNVFDTEVGFDLVKTVQLEKSKLDVTFGASYVRAMGDIDDEYSAKFYGANGEGSSFDILGAELAENTIKANLTAEVTRENGFFYNAGVTYRFGSDNTEDYGANVGVGYSF